MLVADDILCFPFRGLGFILRQIHRAAQQELVNEADHLRAELSELYMRLETRQITEAQFAARESPLLDRLARAEAQDDAAETESDHGPEIDA